MQSIRNVSGAARAQRSECADARTVSARGGERLDLGRKMVAGEASVRGNSEWNLSPVCRRRGGILGTSEPQPAAGGGDGGLLGTVVSWV